MAANAIDLCLAADVASDLGVASDALVQRVVTAASRAIASYCGRKFEKATGIVEYPRSYDRPLLMLARAPILSITSIYENGNLLGGTDYESIGENVDAGLVLRLNGRWLSTGIDVGDITEGVEIHDGRSDGVKVTYDAGYVTPGQLALSLFTPQTLPEDAVEAAIQTAVALYRTRGVDPLVAQEAIGDWSVTYVDRQLAKDAIPPVARSLLAPYLRWGA